ncbi:hypothetical protein LTR84_004775 [Exophiala bonariae]|uniref:Heterokaryon incompatibility domain-containing protein n=1 Tax=Exophiala bonariae TaxID=1690606 RepID=A0AAV9NPI2_9EURO|nr:hypothetical protein LTR84_004775 [Exophiala bonariae]
MEFRGDFEDPGMLSQQQTPVSQLCPRCSSLDIASLLVAREAAAFDEEIKVWEWEDYDHPDWLQSGCSLCDLVSVIKSPYDTSHATAWFYAHPDYMYVVQDDPLIAPIPLELRKVVRRVTTNDSSSVWRDQSGKTNRTWTLLLASRSSVCNQGNIVMRKISSSTIDFNIVKAWISQAISHSQSRAHHQPGLPERLIDCHSNKVVAAGSQPYVTLSYVWGDTMIEFDSVDLGEVLPESIPVTVTDAINVTTKLGYRYLWVDKYCIDQKDGIGRLRQINNMDIIFKNSEVTIVAVAGMDANFGLPGVSTRPRKPQRRVALNGADMTIVSTTPVLQTSIRASKWNSRAWTYQEAHLSSKLLVFTETELYFESRCGTNRETVEAPFPCLDNNLFVYQKPSFDPWNANNPEFVNKAIAEYSVRDLSREEDALIAALGFLKAFQGGPNPVYHHWGVPIFPDQAIRLGHGRKSFPYLGPKAPVPFSHEGFLLGLCWRAAGHQFDGYSGKEIRRRPGLPSWSWAGWSCTLDETPQTVYEVEHFVTHQDVSISLELSDEKTVVPLKELYEFHHSPAYQHTFSHFIHLNIHTIPLGFRSLPREEMTPADRDICPEPYALAFEDVVFPFCYGGWGTRTNSFISLLPVEELSRRVVGRQETSLLGLVLGRFEDKRDWPYGMQYILVALERDGHYERIGYIRQGDRNIDLNFRSLLEEKMRRQSIRLG